jgi:hypothetical protein
MEEKEEENRQCRTRLSSHKLGFASWGCSLSGKILQRGVESTPPPLPRFFRVKVSNNKSENIFSFV